MRRLTILCSLVILAALPLAQSTAQQNPPVPQASPQTNLPILHSASATVATLKSVYVPGARTMVKFPHRRSMTRSRVSSRMFHLPSAGLPPVALPNDNTGNQTVPCPMDGNDQYGDCGEAMAAHADNIYTFRQGRGTASVFDPASLVNQYLARSAGDNGMDEPDVLAIWTAGIGGNPQATIVDSLDIDVTSPALAQYALANFGTIQMAWSVPDSFIQNFATGARFTGPGIPDPSNGHYTPLADIDSQGNYSLWTWGSYCWVSPSFVASVQPQSFVVFSPRNFDPATGLDSKGRHITTQASAWVACGGNPIPLSVIQAFPPIGPIPTPNPTPAPTPSPTPGSAMVLVITTPTGQSITVTLSPGSSVAIAGESLTISGSTSVKIAVPTGSSITIGSEISLGRPQTAKRAA